MNDDLRPQSCIQYVPIFKSLTAKELDEVILISSHRHINKGEFIFHAGDNIHSLYVIHRGKVKIARYSEEGKEQIIRLIGHGDFLGELALFNEEKVTTFAEAIEPTVVCLIDANRLRELMLKAPTLSYKMMAELSKRLEKAESLLENSNLLNAEQKVVRYLLELEREGYVKFSTSKINIARNLGITPETLSRKLKGLEEHQLIRTINNRLIKVINLEQLKQRNGN
jgi:CRP/FNR family transcriptional regulator